MSLSVLLAPAAGWYPDPAGQAVYRWWDGEGWTAGTHDGETSGTHEPEPAFEVVAPASTPPASKAESAEPKEPVSFAEAAFADPERYIPVSLFAEPAPAPTSEPAPAPDPEPAFDEPAFTEPAFAQPSFGQQVLPQPSFAQQAAPLPDFAAPAAAAPAVDVRAAKPAPVKTKWSSLLVAFPFVFPVVVGMVIALAYAGGAAGNTIALAGIGGVTALALFAVAFMFADHDRRDLKAAGYQPVPSLAWMLLLPPIVYLLARRRVVGPRY